MKTCSWAFGSYGDRCQGHASFFYFYVSYRRLCLVHLLQLNWQGYVYLLSYRIMSETLLVFNGAIQTQQYMQEGAYSLQDLVLILVSAISFLFLVLDAFWHENGYQLLVCMASGCLNLIQLIVYAVCNSHYFF